jgi:putative MFS transporter
MPGAQPLASQPELNSVVDRIGWGRAQFLQLFAGGGIFLADGAELLLFSAVAREVAIEWKLSHQQRGFAVSLVYIGMLTGNVICGPMGDRYGRKPLVLSSYFGLLVFSLLSSIADSYATLVFYRFLAGIAIGLGTPSWIALGAELSPGKMRERMLGFSMALFCIGESFTLFLIWMDNPAMVNLQWRRLLLQASIAPAVFIIIALAYLEESPRYLAIKQKPAEARQVLERMSQYNGIVERDGSPIDVHFAPVAKHQKESAATWHAPLKTVFDRRFLLRTIIGCQSAFTVNFLYNGGLYAFPQVIPHLGLKSTPVHDLLLAVAFELPGYIVGAYFLRHAERRTALISYLLASFFAHIPFMMKLQWISNAGPHWEWCFHVGLIGCKAFVSIGWVTVYSLVSEIYPTASRVTGSAICVAAGRLGAIICPLAYEASVEYLGSSRYFFLSIGVLCILNCSSAALLPSGLQDLGGIEEDPLVVSSA